MSHYETPEQRQIIELRTKISEMTREVDYQAFQNSSLRSGASINLVPVK